MVKAIIMAGGEGTRLRPLTCNRAKPMIPVINKPVIEHAIDLLKKHNIKDIIISLFYLPENIQNYFADGSEWGVNITYSVEESPLGTAGGVRKAIANPDDTFIVLSGDGIIDFDLTKVIEFHKSKESPFTIVLKRVKEPTDYGIVITESDGKIVKFHEKPSWSEVFTDTANTGMYVIEPWVLKDNVPENEPFDFSFDLFPLLQEKKIPMYGHISNGYWCDVGTIDSYRNAHFDIIDGLVKIEVPGKMIKPNVWIGKNVEIHPNAIITGPAVIGDFVKIKEKADISDFAIIGNNTTVESGASIRRSIVLHSTVIGSKSELRGSIIGKRCVLEENVSVYEGAVVSDDCEIGSNTEIPSGTRVWPGKVIESGTKLTSDLIWGKTERKALFSGDGITGTFNVKITPEFAAKLGSAIGAFFGNNSRVTISRDAKGSSRIIKRAITSGMLSMGVEVFDMEIESIPVTRYSTRYAKADCGIHVQISPMTGLDIIIIKLFDKNGFRLHLGIEKKIEKVFFRGDYPRKAADEVGQLHYPTHHIESYIDNTERYINKSLLLGKSFDIIVDCFRGAASYVFPDLLAYYGCNTTILRGQIRYGEKRIDHKKETRKAINSIRNMCKANKEIGVLIGPNGEYITVVDETGDLLQNEEINSLICIYYIKHKGIKTINIPVTATRNIEKITEKFNADIKRISTKMRSPKNLNDIFLENESGLYPHLAIDYDPMISFIHLLEFAAVENNTLYKLRQTVPHTNITSHFIQCSHEEKAAIMRYITENIANEKKEMKDGVRIIRENSWILILPDSSQPLIHLYAEGDSDETRDEILTEFSVLIKSYKGSRIK